MSNTPALVFPWLPTTYRIAGHPKTSDEVLMERAEQLEGPALWKIRQGPFVLNRDGEWEYEPLPSSRDEEYLARTRFESTADAYTAYRRAHDGAS